VIEAEVCGAVADALTALGFTDFVIRLNHRQLLTSMLNGVGIAEPLHGTALVAVDKLDKIGADGVRSEMETRGIAAESATSSWRR
jgi:histidyl-tRNA synthetase